jgi:L-seryl-tRNA(Ser) seleniumtransferase
MTNPMLRTIPSVNELLESPPLRRLVDRVSHSVVVTGVRRFLDNLRHEMQSAAAELKVPGVGELAEKIADWIVHEDRQLLRPVVNATGIVLHTGLGRAPLPAEALRAIADVGHSYASLEVDLASGERSQRGAAVEQLLKQLTGAESAAVVNNNAAATLLALAALAAGREAIVSRGQLIEIGGSYRLPEVMAASGAKLREVGTTNKTRLRDYEVAVTNETAVLLRVHTSNFRVVGFTEEVPLAELVRLGRKCQLPVIDDIGSGALIDLNAYGVHNEPIAAESIKAGANLVLFSGDKLLGGPQCGIIVGDKSLVEKITSHPMMRAMRVDKCTLAALAATLRLYRDPSVAERSIPLLSLLATTPANLRNRAERMAPQMTVSAAIASAEPVQDMGFLGGGAVPTQEIPTWCVALTPADGNVTRLAQALRNGDPPVFGRVHKDRLLLDLRTVFPQEDISLVNAIVSLGPISPADTSLPDDSRKGISS